MWPIALVAVGVLAVVGSAFAAATPRGPAGAGPRRLPAWMCASLVALLLWAPYAWLLLLPTVDESYHRDWLGLWPVLPGLPAMMLARSFMDLGENAERLPAAAMTVGLYATLVLLARRGPRWLVAVVLVGAAYGAVMGRLSYALFAM